jgi:hypothetical protein
MGPIVDLEADRGEGFDAYLIDDDVAPLKVESSANIACGFPAGERKMPRWPDAYDGRATSAHPSLPDLRCFTRGPERLFAYDGTDSASCTHGWLPRLGGPPRRTTTVCRAAPWCGPAVDTLHFSGIVNGSIRWSALRKSLDARAPRNDQRGVRLPA